MTISDANKFKCKNIKIICKSIQILISYLWSHSGVLNPKKQNERFIFQGTFTIPKILIQKLSKSI
ncbi:hypothetical protein pb186bvf_008552 [Paramecium bursaria]